MFQHLKIGELKALNEAILLELGRVNVICGKNNSGKSTLLECINNPDKRMYGLTITENEKKEFSAFIKLSDWWQALIDDTDQQRFDEILNTVIGSRKAWFSQDSAEFSKLIDIEVRKHIIENVHDLDTGLIGSSFLTLFRQRFSTILLPPKRNLEPTRPLGQFTIAPEGTGILNCLFHSKNQITGSSERDFFESLKKAFEYISAGYDFDLSMEKPAPNAKVVLHYSYRGEGWIGAVDSGLGLQDLLVILFFALHNDPW